MTTLLITNDFGPRSGGIEAFNRAICSWLGDVVVLTADQPGALAHDAALGFSVVRRTDAPRLNAGGRRLQQTLLPDLATAKLATALIKHHRIKRVVISAVAPLGLLAPALRRAGAEVIIGVSHGHEASWAAVPLLRPALGRMIAGLDACTVISTATRRRIAKAIPAELRGRLIMLAPPVDPGFFDIERAAGGPPRFLIAARAVRQKGMLLACEAWAMLGERAPELSIAGAGPELSKLRSRAARSGGKIRLLGAVPPERMPALMANHHALIAPSLRTAAGLVEEGFGLVCAEAGAAGLAVLASDSGGHKDIVAPGRNGWLFPPGDARALAELVRTIATEGDQLAEAGAAGRGLARRFDGTDQRLVLRAALGLPEVSAGRRVAE